MEPPTPNDVYSDATDGRVWVERAERRVLQIPMRYRIDGQEDWSNGETVNLSETGILFSADSMLEVNDKLVITFQTLGAPMLSSSTRLARVVRRVLSNWPETRPLIAVRFG